MNYKIKKIIENTVHKVLKEETEVMPVPVKNPETIPYNPVKNPTTPEKRRNPLSPPETVPDTRPKDKNLKKIVSKYLYLTNNKK